VFGQIWLGESKIRLHQIRLYQVGLDKFRLGSFSTVDLGP